MTLVVPSALRELDEIEMMSVLSTVVTPRTRELQMHGIVTDTVEAGSEDSRPRQQLLCRTYAHGENGTRP